jgi:hypothetical protein
MLIRPRSGIALLGLALVGALAVGCSRSAPREKGWVPPRVDLSRHGTLGMIEFSGSGAEGLGEAASREFLAAIQSAQPGTPVLELGEERHVLAERGDEALGPEAIRAIGERHRVDALVVGRVKAQSAVPGVAFDASAGWATATAELQGTLDARIFDTRTGATVWSTATRAREPLARVDLSSTGVTGLGRTPGEEAHLRLVRSLVADATRDFWGRWN